MKNKDNERWIVRISLDSGSTWRNLSLALLTCDEAMGFAESWKKDKTHFPCRLKVSKLIELPYALWDVT